jgi:small basic protein (TIGR04137 family)
MSIDRSLKAGGAMAQTRSVLTRGERITKMIADRKMDPNKPKALSLPKTRVSKA